MPIDLINRAKIKKLRDDNDRMSLTRAAAATKGKITRQQWAAIEKGDARNPQLETLEAMAKVFGLTAKDLLR